MTLQWPVRYFNEENIAREVLKSHHEFGIESTISRETLLTPEHAAVIEAAKEMAHQIPISDSYHRWVAAQNGLLAAVATLRELEGEV
jgi:hypothetical protein